MSFLSGLGKVLSIGGGLASLIPGVGTAVGTGLGVLGGALSGSAKQGQADKMNQQALQMAIQRYKETAPLRSQALALGQNLQPGRPNLSSAFASGNPFARQRPDLSMLAMPGGTPTTATPVRPPMGGGMMAPSGDPLQAALRRRQELV